MRIQKILTAAAMLMFSVSASSVNVYATPTTSESNRPVYSVVHGWPILPEGESLKA